MKFGILSAFLLWSAVLSAQLDFTPLQAKGEIPSTILSLAAVGYESDKGKVTASDRATMIRQDDFYLKHNYGISQMLKNGQILFGDELTTYVKEIGDKILDVVPSMKGKVEFYVVKDVDVNAHAAQKGIIFVNVGLLAQIENEAQLAFVLIHELVHYMEDHGVKGYVKKEAIRNRDKAYRAMSVEERIDKYIEYSKEYEYEADTKGLKDIYLKLGYDINEAIKVFDVLLYSYLPFDEIKFDTNYFNDEYFRLPSGYFLDKANEITAVEDYDDSRSVHPNIKKRRENIFKVVEDVEIGDDGKAYLLGEERFLHIRKLARYELCQLFLDKQEYGKALYSSYMLLKDDSSSQYLNRIHSYALYAFAKYYNIAFASESGADDGQRVYYVNGNKVTIDIEESSSPDVLIDMDEVEGQSSVLYHLINEMTAKERNIVALRQIFKSLQYHPEDAFLASLAEDCIYDLHKYHELGQDDFKMEYKADTTTFKELTDEEYEALSKYDKIRYDKKKKEFEEEDNEAYLMYAFLPFKDVEVVDDLFEKVEERLEQEEKDKEEFDDLTSDERADYDKEQEYLRSHPGVDKLVVVNPVFNSYRKGEYKYIRSEMKENDMLDMMQMAAHHAGVDVEVLDVYDFRRDDIQKFNDLSLLMRFYIEHFSHEEQISGHYIINSNLAYVSDVADRYNTDYFSISFMHSSVQPRDNVGYVLAYSIVLFFPLPYGIYYALTPEKEMEYYNHVVNARTGDAVYSDYKVASSRDRKYLMKSMLYGSYYKMHQKPKN